MMTETSDTKDGHWSENSNYDESDVFTQLCCDSTEILHCNSENIGKCLEILTREMRDFGLVPYSCDNFNDNNITPLIQATLKLVKMHHSLSLSYDDLHSRHLRATNDLHCSQSGISRLKETIDQKERNLIRLQENERFLYEENKNLTSKIKTAKDEIKRLNSVAQSRQVQFNHDGRKKESEINKLKDRLEALMTSKISSNDRRFGIDVANFICRQNGSRGQWKIPPNETKQEKEFLKDVIQSFEERFSFLVNENKKLREIHKESEKLSQDKAD